MGQLRPLRLWLRNTMNSWWRHLVVSCFVLAIAAVVESGHEPDEILWHAIVSFCMLLGVIMLAAPILGIILVYHRRKLRPTWRELPTGSPSATLRAPSPTSKSCEPEPS